MGFLFVGVFFFLLHPTACGILAPQQGLKLYSCSRQNPNHWSEYVCSQLWLFLTLWLFVTLWTVAYQAPLFMEFSRQEHWSEWPFPSPRDLSDPGIKLASPALASDSLPTVQPGKFNPNHWTAREFLVWVFFKYYLPWTPCLVPFDKCYAFLQHTHTNLILLDQETIEGTCMFIPL